MTLLANILVFLHIATAPAWFGMALRLPAHARLASTLGGSAAAQVGTTTVRSINMMGVFLGLAFVFGLTAFFMKGGFSRYGAEYHTSLLLIVVLLAIHFFLIRPTWTRFTDAVVSDNSEDAGQLRKRLGMFVGIGHLIWSALLLLMLWERYFAVL